MNMCYRFVFVTSLLCLLLQTACTDTFQLPEKKQELLRETHRENPAPHTDSKEQKKVEESQLEETDARADVIPEIPKEAVVVEEKVRREEFRLISAFSKDGRNVTLRFSNPVKKDSGSKIEAFRIKPSLNITKASVDGSFVQLSIDPQQRIDPNTVYTVFVQELVDIYDQEIQRSANNSQIKRTLYVNIIWHQHQPMYLDPLKDEMQGPWVRKHATKDYYDMAAVVEPTKNVHMTINLTPVLLIQLQRYIDRMGPYYDSKTNRMKAEEFLKKWARKTDPWIDLLLKETPKPEALSKREKELFYDAPWSTVSTAPQTMAFFPQYEVLRDKNRASYTQQDLRELKFFFEIAWFDPSFLKGPVKMPNGWTVDLSDIVEFKDGKYRVKVKITEDLCNRIVAENYKIMANVVGIHKKLMYNPATKQGQIELITTPFYHPILPLIFDTNLAKKTSQVDDIALPPKPFQYPNDAFAQVAKAKYLFREMFGIDPQGMWPGEGSVAEEVVSLFVQNDLRWIGTGEHNLHRSKPSGQSVIFPYKVDSDTVQGTGGDTKDELMIVFRDDKISDLIGFGLQGLDGENAANTLLNKILEKAPRFGQQDRLLTIILDGENAWENFTQDHDGADFFVRFYAKLEKSFEIGEVVTVTPSEYIDGNTKRNVPPHPITKQKELEPLNPGSWIDGTFRIWIGEHEETCGWNYLLQTRQDLARSGVPRPNPLAKAPAAGTKEYFAYMAWESMYAAQGSDWFWWFGVDMTSPANDDSGFDAVFRSLLTAVYSFANQAGASLRVPNFRPCVQPKPKPVPTQPCSQCPVMDGKFSPDTSEWTNDGGFLKDDDSSSPTKTDPNDDIAALYVSFDLKNLFIGLLHNEVLKQKLGKDYKIFFYFSHRHILDKNTGKVQDDKPINTATPGGIKLTDMKTGGAVRRLQLDFSGTKIVAEIQRADGNGGWKKESSNVVLGGPVASGKLLEIGIPWSDLNLTVGAKDKDPLQMLAVVEENKIEIDQAPNFGVFTVFEDASDAVYVTFEVDISGKEVPIHKYGNCCKQQPKPTGPASVFIVGNHRKLGMVGVDAQGKPIWIPNKIQMDQDKQNPSIWRFTIALPKGMKVNYKYTIGTNSDEGRWRGTEEFPVTFRGFTAEDKTGNRCIYVKDIFANKASGGRDGAIGSKTVLDVGCKNKP